MATCLLNELQKNLFGSPDFDLQSRKIDNIDTKSTTKGMQRRE